MDLVGHVYNVMCHFVGIRSDGLMACFLHIHDGVVVSISLITGAKNY